ncbi:putative transaldolase protein [Lasiodiplodia theobromae]|uniref:Transaldolase protein n=1 Tax=Lasiodiplodia theobromae TaxID=45133 RepID=UPI0015C35EAB|nr:Transaldolase protein [Lasiodiplodia theobromae]KAF4533797.1 Transaldolase protein [Lasiodiplodia theobromae]KAF9638089.1 putative transaldolase protein [Lasiodiplodia theobromae]
MASQTLLDVLRSRTAVDCDTLDASVAAELGPFVDCTSNQAIACSELQEDRHKDLLKKAATLAKDASPKYPGVKLETLAVEIAMILLALQVYPHLTGFVHIQANPFDAYNTAATVAGARRIVSLFKDVDSAFDTTRICIKIASTWEGLQACRQLEAEHNIRTLATTLFTLEQAALAAEVGCRYIAPYVNELRVHFDKSYTDPSPNLPLCATIQRYYTAHSLPTQVLPASLTSAAECMQLAGVHHITVAPALLRELAATKTGDDTPAAKAHSLFDDASAAHAPVPPKLSYAGDEAGWRMALTRAGKGREEGKLVYAINTFCDMQVALEKALKGVIAAL